MGALERARMARRGRLGGGGARQPPVRISVERGAGRAGDGDRHRRACRAHGLLGAAVRDARLGRGAARARGRRRRPSSSPPVHGGWVRVLRRAGPKRRGRTRTGRPSWRPTLATTRASPGTPRSSRPWARCTAATSIAMSSSPAPWRTRTAAIGATAWPPTSTASSRAAGSTRHSRSPRSPSPPARSLGNPYWIAYALWIAGMAFSKADVRRAFAAWDEGVAFVREHRVQFFEGFLARDAARLHTSDGEPEAALVLFAEAIAAFHRAGNVPQLIITLASVPALFERLDRPAPAAMLLGALSREPSSFHHVPELGRSRRPGRAASSAQGRAAELLSAGAALDLSDAAVYARQQIDAALPRPEPPGAPGAARWAEPAGDRGAPPRGRRPDGRRDRHAAVHLVEDGRAPHPEHLHEDRRLQPRRGDPLGRQAPGRRRRRRTADGRPAGQPDRAPRLGPEMGRSTDAVPGATSGECPLRRPNRSAGSEIRSDPARRENTS